MIQSKLSVWNYSVFISVYCGFKLVEINGCWMPNLLYFDGILSFLLTHMTIKYSDTSVKKNIMHSNWSKRELLHSGPLRLHFPWTLSLLASFMMNQSKLFSVACLKTYWTWFFFSFFFFFFCTKSLLPPSAAERNSQKLELRLHWKNKMWPGGSQCKNAA